MARDRRPLRHQRAQRQGPLRRPPQLRGQRLTDSSFDEKRGRLAERLQSLRRRLDAPADDQDLFELDLYSYDESLVVAADLLDVEVPKGARGEMSAEHRSVLEERLAAAGIDVRA